MQHPVLQKPQYQIFRAQARRFIDEHLTRHALDWERIQTFPHHLLADFAQVGFIGLSIPQKHGGQGKSPWYDLVLVEELAQCQTFGFPMTLLVHSQFVLPLVAFLASNDHHRRFVAEGLTGKTYLALAVTEADAGSDIAATGTSATVEQGLVRLDGEKIYISNASVAGAVVVFAKSAVRSGMFSFDLYLVPRRTKGMSQKRLDTVGLRSGDQGMVTFDRCLIPESFRLGTAGHGFSYVNNRLQYERLVSAVYFNALTSYALDETVKLLQQRKRFGEALSKKQVLRHRLVQLRAEVTASTHFGHGVFERYVNEQNVDQEIMMLKITAVELCQKVLRECVQLRGAAGFVRSDWVANVAADAACFSIFGGTSEILRDVLASSLEL